MWLVALGWNVMYEAPASMKSLTIRSTGETMRCTSIGDVTPWSPGDTKHKKKSLKNDHQRTNEDIKWMPKVQHLTRKDRMFKHSIGTSMFRGEYD